MVGLLNHETVSQYVEMLQLNTDRWIDGWTKLS